MWRKLLIWTTFEISFTYFHGIYSAGYLLFTHVGTTMFTVHLPDARHTSEVICQLLLLQLRPHNVNNDVAMECNGGKIAWISPCIEGILGISWLHKLRDNSLSAKILISGPPCHVCKLNPSPLNKLPYYICLLGDLRTSYVNHAQTWRIDLRSALPFSIMSKMNDFFERKFSFYDR